MWLEHFIGWYLDISVFYFLAANVTYLVLLAASIQRVWYRQKTHPLMLGKANQSYLNQLPAISILSPAFNEEKSLVDSVTSLLKMDYPEFEVVIINDGSTDETFERARAAFQLFLEPQQKSVGPRQLSLSKVRGVYRSALYKNLRLIDKDNGGKADALNMGVDYSRHSVICSVDSDSILDADALQRIITPFVEEPTKTIACGGTIRVLNGNTLKNGKIHRTGVPKNFFGLIQIVEYMRAFLFGRAGWDFFDSTVLISGAFGLFKKRALLEVGGYRADSIGEDMELVVRLHSEFKRRNIPYLIKFIPDPVCWTEVPSQMSSLYVQRHRWQRGLADTLYRHKNMILNPRHGVKAFTVIPYLIFVEFLGPLIEIGSYLCLIGAYWLDILNRDMALLFVLVGLLFSATISLSAILVEELTFLKYPRLRDLLWLMVAGILENFVYRQLTMFWRLAGLVGYLRRDKAWGDLAKKGVSSWKPKPKSRDRSKPQPEMIS